MPIERLSLFGNPNIGVYIFANDEVALIPPGLDEDSKEVIARTLNVKELVEVRIAGMTIIGVLIAGNNKGILLPRIVEEHEVKKIKSAFSGNVAILNTKATALGNIVLANDRAAIVYPDIEDSALATIKEVLEVEEVVRRPIADIVAVGAAGVVTNKGGLVHPDTTDQELKELSDIFGVPIDVGTINFGVAFIKTGLVANSRGALVGEKTTGPEIMRITQVLRVM